MSNDIKAAEILDSLENDSYRHLSCLWDRWRRDIIFRDSGKARLAHIVGYIIGLKHAGEEETAIALTESLHACLERLKGHPVDVTFNEGKGDATVSSVPSSKCIVGDDGTMHGFTLLWCHAIDPSRYRECYDKHLKDLYAEKENGEETYDTAHERVVKELNILERVDASAPYSEELTEYRAYYNRVFYRPVYNGGLIYHGPGAGETFSVAVGRNLLWSIHT